MADYIIAPNGELYHFGVKGMKWGVRKDRNKSTKSKFDHTNELDKTILRTKSGAELTLSRTPTPAFTKFLAKHSSKVRETLKNSDIMRIKSNGKNVGELQLYKESPTSLNVVWLGVDKKHEGLGYGTAAMRGVVEYAKKTKCKTVTLEVPGVSPNARHIYEKIGFKSTGEILGDDDDAWGGLTKMRLDLE